MAHVHGAAFHGTSEDFAGLVIGDTRTHPVIGGTDVTLETGADVGKMLSPCDIVLGRAMQITAGQHVGVERQQLTLLYGHGRQPLPFLLRAITPINVIRLAHRCHPIDPSLDMCVFDHRDTFMLEGASARWLKLTRFYACGGW